MILGAGIYQVPLIKAAKEEDCYTIVVSIPGDYPGFEIADQVAYINTTDYESVLELAKKEKIDAIVTTGTDVALITLGYVCSKLNLNGLSFDAAKLVTDKSLMKAAFTNARVSTAAHKTVYSLDEAIASANEIGYPVMIKIVDKSGSRGITRVCSDEELIEAYEYGKDITNSDHMIVEKCIEAREIGVDAFVQSGKLKFFFPHDKLVYRTNRTGIPKGHINPIEMSKELYDELYCQTELSIKALHLDNCAINMDVFITDDNKVYVIEATGRCGATGIPEVITTYTGVDYYKAILRNAIGENVSFGEYQNQRGAVASVLLFSEKSGTLEFINCNEKLAVDVTFDYQKGQKVQKVVDGTDRIGMAVIQAETKEKLLEKIKCFEKSIEISVSEM